MVALISFGVAGCGTITNLAEGDPSRLYGGVVVDSVYVAEGFREPLGPVCPGFLFTICGVIDMPLSIVGDTLTVPWVLAIRSNSTEHATSP